MDTHPKIASFILQIFNSPGMNIPAQMAEQVVEAKSWLAAIGQLNLIVGLALPPAPPPSPTPPLETPEGANGG